MAVDFLQVIKRLLPPGRLFRLPYESTFYKLNKVIGNEAQRVKTFIDDTVNDGIPGNISVDSLVDWESDLAIQKNNALSISERNARITSKLTAQGGQGKDYLQSVLHAAGFDVYLHEWQPGLDPNDYIASSNDIISVGEVPQLFYESSTAAGEPTSIAGEPNMVAGEQTTGRAYEISVLPVGGFGNRVTDSGDTRITDIGDTRIVNFLSYDNSELWPAIFYICDAVFPNRAIINADREREFKTLVLSKKPVRTWALALVDYV